MRMASRCTAGVCPRRRRADAANDPARTGAQLHETLLQPSNVSPTAFGRLYERHVDGQIIAQPLYISNLSIPNKGPRNVVYVATRANTVYAFDADDTDPDPTLG